MLWASATDLSFQGGGVLNKACPYNMVPWTERSKLENTFYGHSAVREHNCTVFSYSCVLLLHGKFPLTSESDANAFIYICIYI